MHFKNFLNKLQPSQNRKQQLQFHQLKKRLSITNNEIPIRFEQKIKRMHFNAFFTPHSSLKLKEENYALFETPRDNLRILWLLMILVYEIRKFSEHNKREGNSYFRIFSQLKEDRFDRRISKS